MVNYKNCLKCNVNLTFYNVDYMNKYFCADCITFLIENKYSEA